MTGTTNMEHFEALRSKINSTLEEIEAPHREQQTRVFSWLYGALGEVPSDVMFICENPSLAGVTRADVQTVDGDVPDIEAQWWGGPRNPAAKRFREALYRLDLKRSPPAEKGGWRCYITNVIKELNVTSDNQALASQERAAMARTWAPILAWEMDQVEPRHVFTVGRRADAHVRRLSAEGLIPDVDPVMVTHYSARLSDEDVINGIIGPVGRELNRGSSHHSALPEVNWDLVAWDVVDDAALGVMYFGLHDGPRTWKGFAWELLDRLHAKGYISDPVGRAKSVVLTDKGLERSMQVVRENFARKKIN